MQSGPRCEATTPESASSARRGWRPRAAWPGCGRSAWSSAAKTRSVPSWPSTDIAAAMSAVRSSSRRSVDRQHQHAEHAVGAVDQRQALLGGQLDRRQAGGGERVGGRHQGAVGVADLALAHQRERAVRQRRQVAGAAERAVLVHHRRDAVGEQVRPAAARSPGVRRCGRSPASRAAAASAPRTTSRSTSGPDPAACDRTSERCSCARISVGMCRVASAPKPVEMPYAGVGARRAAPRRRPGPARSRSRPRPSSDTAGTVPGDGDDVVEGHRADAHGDGVVMAPSNCRTGSSDRPAVPRLSRIRDHRSGSTPGDALGQELGSIPAIRTIPTSRSGSLAWSPA